MSSLNTCGGARSDDGAATLSPTATRSNIASSSDIARIVDSSAPHCDASSAAFQIRVPALWARTVVISALRRGQEALGSQRELLRH